MKNNNPKTTCLFIYQTLCIWVSSVLVFLGFRKDCTNEEIKMQSGELIVSGQDCIEIPLRGEPLFIKVQFKDHCLTIPCNPHQFDELEWEIVKPHHHHHNHYRLYIQWDVSVVREILWTVYF